MSFAHISIVSIFLPVDNSALYIKIALFCTYPILPLSLTALHLLKLFHWALFNSWSTIAEIF